MLNYSRDWKILLCQERFGDAKLEDVNMAIANKVRTKVNSQSQSRPLTQRHNLKNTLTNFYVPCHTKIMLCWKSQ
jgi:hypothetical protein